MNENTNTKMKIGHWERVELVKEILMLRMTRSQEAGRRILHIVNQHGLTEQEVAQIFEDDMRGYWQPVVETVGEEVVEK